MADRRRLVVEVIGDTSNLERGFRNASRAGQRFEGTMERTGRSLARTLGGVTAGLIGAGGLSLALKQTVDAASDLNEEVNKSRVIFGRSSGAIIGWSTKTSKAIGLSQRATLSATGNFGSMFKTIGIGNEQAAAMSRRFVTLGADMASFNNEDPSEMLDRLRSGLAGEAEPLRRFGVLLSEARVKTEAYATGIAQAGAKLTEQQKVAARYSLILKDTTLAQNDFARTSGSLANQQRILRANIENLEASLGQVLLPTVTRMVTQFNKWLENPENKKKVIDGFATSVHVLGESFKFAASTIKTFKDVWDKIPGKDISGLDLIRKSLNSTPLRAIGLNGSGGSGLLGMPNAPGGRGALDILLAGASRGGDPFADARVRSAAPGTTTRASVRAAGVSQSLRNQWFDNAIARTLDRAQDITSLGGRKSELGRVADLIRGQMAIVKDATRRLNLEDKLVSVLRDQKALQDEITSGIKAGNQALKDRADAIKSAVLDRLQRRQTDILNRRAMADAQDALRIARQIGGPAGIEAARRGVQDVGFDIARARFERAPASLRGGMFSLGAVTINVNGTDSPEAVAQKVITIIQRKGRHATKQTRGPFADQRIQ